MTREEAIWYLTPIAESASLERYKEALSMAVSALREQEERENPKPLTLDELKLMDGEPVWLLPDRKCFIVNNDFQLPYGERIPCGVDMWGAGTGLSLLARCGVYRSKPKEDE